MNETRQAACSSLFAGGVAVLTYYFSVNRPDTQELTALLIPLSGILFLDLGVMLWVVGGLRDRIEHLEQHATKESE